MGSALQVLEGVLQEIWWMQFKVIKLLPLPEITACRNRKQRMGYLSCPVGCRLLSDV